MKIEIPVPGNSTVTVEADSHCSLFSQAAMFQSLPHICPIDGTPTRLGYRRVGDYEYYQLENTGDFRCYMKMGVYNDKEQNLYLKPGWFRWNGTEEVEVSVSQQRPHSEPPQEQAMVVPTSLATVAMKNTIHALGLAYNDGDKDAWDELRKKQVAAAFQVDSLNEITEPQARNYIAKLEKKVLDQCAMLLKEMGISSAKEAELVSKVDSAHSDVSKLNGVPLAKVCQALNKMDQAPV